MLRSISNIPSGGQDFAWMSGVKARRDGYSRFAQDTRLHEEPIVPERNAQVPGPASFESQKMQAMEGPM